MGSGSARIVYQIDNDKVLKLAKNKKGIAQNDAEGEWYWQRYGIFAHVIDIHPESQWIEMELAKKAKLSDFDKILNLPHAFHEYVCPYIKMVCNRYDYKRIRFIEADKEKELQQLEESPDYEDTIFSDLEHYLTDSQLTAIGDLIRLSSWGIVKRDGKDTLVLVDFGYTDWVRDEYYIKSK